MASLKVDDITKESREMSPTVEEELSPTDQDTLIAPPPESEKKEIPVSDEEKEKHTTTEEDEEEEEEEEKPAESWPIIEEADQPDASFEAGSRGTAHDFGEDGDEDEDDD